MTKKDKTGISVLICLFIILGVVLVWAFKPVGSAQRGFSNNEFVKQRVINLNK